VGRASVPAAFSGGQCPLYTLFLPCRHEPDYEMAELTGLNDIFNNGEKKFLPFIKRLIS
jgi:hypothetical protein